ncbi:exodeoxyribonuclease-5 [Ancylobacter sp. 3268]|uniref:ATP-dependent DNA helicase n=1 Tax=Ancylobacter sp. 3268 TaxID=2817752 RepID=UPI00285FCEA1|nr:AAA family ATPase [Ancylobacter sp. 3268]MDR6954195.1 exodeoxyribonuclease-5 [Ancylobacter sp. 3268]
MTQWSPQQNEALSKAGAWLRLKYAPTFYLAGYAGTGKTTLAKFLAGHAKGKVAFAAYTGKAAAVMRSKGCKGASTIHGLIYNTDTDPNTGALTTKLVPPGSLDDYCLIVVDEVSMVDEVVGKDLLSFGIPVLVLGDPEQLPPVNGAGYFTNRDPDYLLTEIHRQAAESPIVRLATEIREGRFTPRPIKEPGLVVCDRHSLVPGDVTKANVVIVGKNETRQKFNRRLRQLAGRSSRIPHAGETLICLRNDHETGIFNGEIFSVVTAKLGSAAVSLRLQSPDGDGRLIDVNVLQDFFDDDVAAAKLSYRDLYGTQQLT